MKKIFLIGCSFFIFLLIILASISLWLISAIFDKSPSVVNIKYEANPLVVMSVIEKLKQSAEGIDISTLLLSVYLKEVNDSQIADEEIRKLENKVLEFSLSEQEVNELIKYGIAYYLSTDGEAHRQALLKNTTIEFKDGVFDVKCSLDSGISTPFGQFINFECKFVPKISKKDMQIDVNSFKIGKIFFSTKRLNAIIEEQIKKEKENNANLKKLFEVIIEAKIEGNTLRIRYSPYELIKILLTHFAKEYKGTEN